MGNRDAGVERSASTRLEASSEARPRNRSRAPARLSAIWRAHTTKISVAALVLLSLIVVVPRAVAPVTWTPDGLFYQAQMYELEGQSQSAALHRVFTSPVARHVPAPDVHHMRWVRYSAANYRRRWLVPALAVAISPIAGSRSLLDVSLLGYLLLGPVLFAMLRIRFSPGVCLVAAAVCLLLPPTRVWAGHPLTDSWGVTMTAASLIAAYYAVQRGGRHILWWILAILAVSITRDTVLVPLGATAAAALLIRSRRTIAVLMTGVAAALPAYLLFGAPLVREMAYNLNGYHEPAHPNLQYDLSHYVRGLRSVVDRDLHYPRQFGRLEILWEAVGAGLVAAVLFTITRVRPRDPFLVLQVGGLVGAAATIAVAVNYTFMRLELVFLPGVAAALAYTLSELNRHRLWGARWTTAWAARAR